jgi:hypothetical protein
MPDEKKIAGEIASRSLDVAENCGLAVDVLR